ncbi:MAG: alpha/beta fold hydrolase [Actinomycetota bacterium]
MTESSPLEWQFAGDPPKIAAGNIQIAYERAGDGDGVLLIMGLGAGRRAWKFQMPSLSKRYDVVCFDNRGAGDSDAPEQGWSLEDMTADAMAVMDAVGFQRAHIVGASVGGCIAQELVLNHPQKALSLTLISAHHGGPDVVPTDPEAFKEIRPAMGGDPQAGLAAIRHSFSAAYLRDHPQVLDQMAREAAEHSPPVHGLRNQVMAAVQWSMAGGSVSRLGQITVPTRVLHGGEDKMVPVENGRMLAEKIPGARLRIWEDAGHNVIMEKAAELNEDLIDHFLGASPAR